MNYLLDTHSFLWSVTDDAKLSENARKAISNPRNEVFVSVVSFWEISIKHSVGKIQLGDYAVEDFIEIAERSQFSILQLDPSIAATGYCLPWRKTHRDPFDRMLIWKAIKKGYSIVSKDSDFKLYADLGLKLTW